MLALHRAGRTAEALAAYQRVRTSIAENLGMEPGHGLQVLHRRILANDPALVPEPGLPGAEPREPDPRAVRGAAGDGGDGGSHPSRDQASLVPRQLPGSTRHFTGRLHELQMLNEALNDTVDASGAVVIIAIEGTAGVGKTALALHWAHSMVNRFPDGQLYVNLRGFDPSGRPLVPGTAIRRLLQALDVPIDRIPDDFDGKVSLYRSLLASKRMLILLDNAVDAAQVRPLLPANPRCPVVVTSRNQLASLVATEGAQLITLDVLSDSESRELLRRVLGAERVLADPDAAGELAELCARLPIALRIAAARVATRPYLSLAELSGELRGAQDRLNLLETEDPSTSVRAVFSWSCQNLSAPALQMFRLIGVHPGPDISAPACASLAGVTLAQANQALDELAQAHLLTEHLPGRFAFHDLLRTYAAEQAADHCPEDARRAAVRRSLDHYLHSARAADRLLYPARDPIPLVAAGPGVTLPALADQAEALAWFRAEHAVLLAAIEQAAKNGFGAHTWQLAWTLVTFQDRDGAWRDMGASQSTALAAARQAGDPAGQAQAHRMLGRAHARLGSHQDALRHLATALELYQQLDDQEGEAHIHTYLGKVLETEGSYEAALQHCKRALELFRSFSNTAGHARALNSVGWCHIQLGNYKYALTCCQQAIALHRRLGNKQGEAHSWDSLGYAYRHLGRHARAVDCYHRAVPLFESIGERFELANALVNLGDSQCAIGNGNGAREAWQQALSIFNDMNHPAGNRVSAMLRQVDAVAAHHRGSFSSDGPSGLLPELPQLWAQRSP